MNNPALDILIVEDNPAHAELIMRALHRHNLATGVLHLTNGEQALDYLFRRGPYENPLDSPRPQLVLLDLRLPRVSGLDVLQAVKQSEDLVHIPVVVLTTSRAEQDVTSAYARNANSYLVKPVEFEQFSEMLRDLGLYWLNWNVNMNEDT